MANATRLSDQARGYFIGKYTGTTAAQNINIGFKPVLILAVQWTDADTWYFWTSDDIVNVNKITTAAANQASAITQVDNGTVQGFSLPACDTVINENSKVYYFIAFA